MAGILIGRTWILPASAIALTLLFVGVGPGHGQEKRLPTTDEIEKAWRARQDRARSAKFAWKEEWTWPKGSISTQVQLASPRSRQDLVGKIMPPADTKVGFSSTLLLHNDKVRFEYQGQQWSSTAQAFREAKHVSVFDSKTAKNLDPIGKGTADWPIAIIRRGEDYRDAGLAVLRPLLLVYRPFFRTMKPSDIKSMTVVPQGTQVIDGRSCIELVKRWPDSSLHFWVDPAREFVLVRQLIIDRELPRQQLDIDYRSDPAAGWVPTSWKIIDYNVKGGLHCSLNALVISADFNVPADTGSFDLEFPPGARVQDERNMEHYIIRLDGTKRPILPQDIGATYHQMLNTAPGRALEYSPQSFPWLIMVLCSIGLTALGVFVWRRLALKKSLSG